MKKIIEKLIGGLEGVKSEVNTPADNVWNNAVKACIDNANELAVGYKSGHFGCNSNGEHEKCRNCELDCKQRNQIWFGVKEEFGKDTNVTTNADRIRSMTDEELAEFLQNVKKKDTLNLCSDFDDGCWYTCELNHCCHEELSKLYIKWLQSKVEGVTENE